MTNQKGTGKGKTAQLGAAYDPTPQLATTVEATGDPNIYEFASQPANGGEWSARGTATRSTGGLVLSSLEVRAGSMALSGVTGNMLRKVPVGVILNHVRANVARMVPTEPEVPQPGKTPRRGGRAALSDDLLRKVAFSYLRETAPERPAGALQRLAAEFERPEGTIRTWLSRARADGWLGPSVKGRAGAEPGPRLLSWVGQKTEEVRPAYEKARQVATMLGTKTRGDFNRAVHASDTHKERGIATRIGIPALPACLGAEVLFGRPLSAEAAARMEREDRPEDEVLSEMGGELRQLFSDKGVAPDEFQVEHPHQGDQSPE
ncbi:hypothetical protein ACIQCF_30095 [Streptomyces sp. NPDC088353]|uniref:hypothetical protein n=1 Tax=Streptomyces sp. NPDC088353 TaxID=3365855 RepID=UPI0038053DD5